MSPKGKAELAELARRYYWSDPLQRKRKVWLDATKRRAMERLADEYPIRFDALLTEERRTGDPYTAC